MSCKTTCKLCNRLIISQSVTFTAGTGLIVNIPADSYSDSCKYCIVVAQSILAATTITAPVYITIGTGTQLYPLDGPDCAQITAAGLRTRTRYSTRVSTTPTGGTFRMLGRCCCTPNNDLTSIDGTAPTTTTGGEGA